jgi:aspartokinase-like uncharacterized kinase
MSEQVLHKNHAPHVVKFGGSLLDRPELHERWARFCDQHDDGAMLMIVGGGAAADRVRAVDEQAGLDASTAHWLAIRAMQFNAHLLAAVLGDCSVVESLNACKDVWARKRLAVLDPLAWLGQEEAAGRGVPHGWHVTSDSIAAYAAKRFGAAQLTLLKSIYAEPTCSLHELAEQSLVDAYFPEAARHLPKVEVVDFSSV